MRNKLKVTAIGMAGLMIGTMFGGCGASSENPGAEKGGQKETSAINIWIAGSGDADSDKAYKTVLDAYCEENPEVEYEITYIPWSDYFTKLNTGLAGAAGPDIFMLGYGQIGAVQRAGNILNLSEYLPKDWDGYEDFHENILDVCKWEGDLYALFKPANRNFFYRKDIAEQNGVTEEDLHITSPEDLSELVEKMTVKDDSGNVVTYGLELDPDEEQELFTIMGMFTEEPKLWNEEYQAEFNSEAGVRAITFEKELYDTGNVCFQDATAATTGLASGVSAMAIGPGTEYVVADSAFPEQIGTVKNDCPNLLIGDYLAVNANTKNPETAVDLLTHMFSKESLTTFAEVAGQYAGRKSVDEVYAGINPGYENIVYAFEKALSYGKPMHPNFGECNTYIHTAMESIFQGADAKQAFEEAAEQWNAVVASAQ